MRTAAVGLEPETMRALAWYYGGLARARAPDPDRWLEPAAVARGAELAAFGAPERKIPSCADCHGPAEDGLGVPRNPAYPEIAGLHPSYLALQLHLFRDGHRGGTAYAHLMAKAAEGLTDDEIAALAAYYGSVSTEAAPAATPASSGR